MAASYDVFRTVFRFMVRSHLDRAYISRVDEQLKNNEASVETRQLIHNVREFHHMRSHLIQCVYEALGAESVAGIFGVLWFAAIQLRPFGIDACDFGKDYFGKPGHFVDSAPARWKSPAVYGARPFQTSAEQCVVSRACPERNYDVRQTGLSTQTWWRNNHRGF